MPKIIIIRGNISRAFTTLQKTQVLLMICMYYLIWLSNGVDYIIPTILNVRKLRFREAKWLAQGLITSKWQTSHSAQSFGGYAVERPVDSCCSRGSQPGWPGCNDHALPS